MGTLVSRGWEAAALALASTVVLAACGGGGDEDVAAPGAGAAGGAGASGSAGAAGGTQTSFASPTAPALPKLTPCPAGWAEKPHASGVTVCEPAIVVNPPSDACPDGWTKELAGDGTPYSHSVCRAPDLPASCPAGSMVSLVAKACVTIGSACPSGTWPASLPTSDVVYVQPGATGTAGTAADPVPTIQAALAIVPAGGTIALAKGTHAAGLSIGKKVTLVGACAAETVVSAPASSPLAVLTSGKGGDVTLRDLRIEGELIGAHASGGPLALRGVWVESVRRFGLLSTGPALDAEDVFVHGTRAMTDGTAGRGLYVYGKGKANARRSTFEENRKVGVSVTDAGSSIELTDVVIRKTREEESSKDLGDGIEATVGGKLVATRLLVEDNLTYGIGCFNAGSSVSLTDVTVRRTEARVKDQKWGVGLMVQESASADLVRVTFDDNRTDGVFGADKATITGTDVVVRRTREELFSKAGGLGLRAELGSKLTFTRTLLDKNREAGVLALSTGSAIVLDHVFVLRTEEGSLGVSPGFAAEQGARIEARHAVVYESHSEGAYAANPGSSLVIEDAAILRTQLSSKATEAAGLAVALDGSVEARRVLIEESLVAGVAVGDGALTLEDAVVRKGTGSDVQSVYGGGLFVQGGGKLTASRVLVAENHTFAVAVRDAGSTVYLSDVVAADTVRQTPSGYFGEGILVQKQGAVTGRRVLVWRSQEEGMLVTSGSATLEDLTVLDVGPDKKGDFGEAIEAIDGAQLTLTRARVGACRGAGVILIDPGSKGTLRDLAVEKVSVDGAGERGYGVGAFSGATLDLANARVEDVSVAGVWGFDATLVLDRVDVRRVASGKGTVIDAMGNPVGQPLVGLADGLLATSNANVTVSKVSVASAARAGILFNASKGSITNVVASDNAYGLVVQGDPRPTVDTTSSFTNNREKDRLDDAGLSVPNRPPAKPSAPP